jgi:hypothetical protein
MSGISADADDADVLVCSDVDDAELFTDPVAPGGDAAEFGELVRRSCALGGLSSIVGYSRRFFGCVVVVESLLGTRSIIVAVE